MRLSQNWLNTDFALDVQSKTLADKLTMAGLEVDSIQAAADDFSGVLIGQVKSVINHPDADKLRITEVDIGSEVLQIVCGAPNVKQGIKVPVATIGALLGDLKIKKSKLRGVESMGMLCSEKELGLLDKQEGLMILPADAPLGENIRDYLQLDDQILDIDITPNRADAFSMLGLAREIGVLCDKKPNDILERIKEVPTTGSDKMFIDNQADSDCPLYLSRIIRGVNNHIQTPLWIKERLRRAGVRPHDLVVDVTNYVMLTLGAPMHAFDRDKVTGENLVIRRAEQGETLVLINGGEAVLDTQTLVIADKERPLAIAGVMGGAHSACQHSSENIILEAAWFAPLSIVGKARNYALSSDSAQRFERGVDCTLQVKAMEMASQLIVDVAGGQVGPIIESIQYEALPQRSAIRFDLNDLYRLTGKSYKDVDITKILLSLGFVIDEQKEDSWQVIPPIWRFDLAIMPDVVEEIIRIDGYHKIESLPPKVSYQRDKLTKSADRHIRDVLMNLGFNEVITYSFIDKQSQHIFSAQEAIRLQNPISSEMSEMRLSMLPGIINTLAYNRRRQQKDIRLFELGSVFIPNGDDILNCQQTHRLGLVATGNRQPEQWGIQSAALDFYDLKAWVEQLMFGINYDIRRSQQTFLHPGQSADILIEGNCVGYFGQLHPDARQASGIKTGDIFVLELDIAPILAHYQCQYRSISKYPQIRRDIALVVDDSMTMQEIQECIDNHHPLLKDSFIFDLFYDGDLLADKKSIAIALILQSDDKTLQDEEVESIIAALVDKLHDRYNVELR